LITGDSSLKFRRSRRSACFFVQARGSGVANQTLLPTCTIFMAEVIRPETSVMLLGTTRVVLESAATWL